MRKILIVEDEEALERLLARLLGDAGFQVSTASDGESALKLAQREVFDLVLLDVQLPGISGLEVLARLHEQPSPPKVIVMTGDNAPETVLQAVRDQAYRYLSKPFEPQQLVELVRNALETPSAPLHIEVLSARPDWVEILVPCDLETAERIQGFMGHLEADLPEDVRQTVGRAFRELLLNAIEWGGRLDPTCRVRIAYLRGRRMVLYRIADPGRGFRFEGLAHSAANNPPDQPAAHISVREEKGMRPGGFGLVLVRAMVDELLYNEAQNEVLFIKYTDASDPGKP